MTTSSQPTVLTDADLAALRQLEGDPRADISADQMASLHAKGMLQDGDDATLSPAGHHAIHIDGPGTVPGLDN